MTVLNLSSYNQYIASAAQTIFTYNFKILAETDLKVYKRPDGDAPDDFNQLIILNVNYTVTGVGNETGGTIILNADATLDDIITIVRERPEERTANYLDNTDLTAQALNDDFDNIVLLIQQVRTDLEKITPKYQYSATQDTKNLEIPILGTNEYWKKTALGIEGVILDESQDWSTLRSELANDQNGTDGSRLVGYYDSSFGSTTVHGALGAVQEGRYGVDSGVADAYVVTLSPAPSALTPGLLVDVTITNSNTGASTINVNGLGVTTIKIFKANVIADTPANSMITGMVARLIYDGSFFQLTNAQELPDFSTGNVALTYDTSIPSGWIKMDDGTIGNAASGATTRADADTQDLFTLLWDEVSSPTANAFCAVSGGLGASALADFTANKQLTLPYIKGRALCGFGAPTGVAAYTPVLGEHEGEPTHVLVEAELATHKHEILISTSAGGAWLDFAGDSNPPTHTQSQDSETTGADAAHNNLQPSTHLEVIIKL